MDRPGKYTKFKDCSKNAEYVENLDKLLQESLMLLKAELVKDVTKLVVDNIEGIVRDVAENRDSRESRGF